MNSSHAACALARLERMSLVVVTELLDDPRLDRLLRQGMLCLHCLLPCVAGRLVLLNRTERRRRRTAEVILSERGFLDNGLGR